MKILLIGEKGQLGWELVRTLMPISEVVSVNYPVFDITDPRQVEDTVSAVRPDLVINPSGYTDVDQAESEPEKAMAVNAEGPGWLAQICHARRIPLIHYSTDFVFDGTKRTPYVETDMPNPINVYGLSKLIGEEAIRNATDSFLIFRLAWLYSTRGNNFVNKFLEWAKKYETVKVVDDQVGNPTWARFVAEATAAILAQSLCTDEPLTDWMSQRVGVYHLTSGGEASRYDWACKIWEYAPNRDQLVVKEVLKAKSTDFPTLAERPVYSPLNCGKTEAVFGFITPQWQIQQKYCLVN